MKTIYKQGSVELAEAEGTSCGEEGGSNGRGFGEGAETRRKEESHDQKTGRFESRQNKRAQSS